MSYCQVIKTFSEKRFLLHQPYHDNEYGFFLSDDNMLFGRLILEINQAGLSWDTILAKKEAFFWAYQNFDLHVVARFDDTDKKRLLDNPGIIRNRKKIDAAIHNANRILDLKQQYGSFAQWLLQQNLDRTQWVKLFKKTFVFTGEQIVYEFLASTGIIEGAHDASCPIYHKVLATNPPWIRHNIDKDRTGSVTR